MLRRECAKLPRCTVEDGLIAIVTDMDEVYPQLPHFGLEDIAAIAQFMLDRCPLLNPLPQAGEEANESLHEFHVK